MHYLQIEVLDIVDARCDHSVLDIVDARCDHEVLDIVDARCNHEVIYQVFVLFFFPTTLLLIN